MKSENPYVGILKSFMIVTGISCLGGFVVLLISDFFVGAFLTFIFQIAIWMIFLRWRDGDLKNFNQITDAIFEDFKSKNEIPVQCASCKKISLHTVLLGDGRPSFVCPHCKVENLIQIGLTTVAKTKIPTNRDIESQIEKFIDVVDEVDKKS